MRHPDYDRAFHETPEYIRSAIELGFAKGKKAMKMRYKITSALSVAAAMVVILGAAAFGASRLGAPRPDGVLPGRPLAGPVATEAAATEEPTPSPAPAVVTIAPEAAATEEPTPSQMPAVVTIAPEAAATEEPTPSPAPADAATPEPTIPPDPMETEAPSLEFVYFSQYGNYFHADPNCSGMQNATEGSVQDAYHAAKEPCPICLADWNFEVRAVPAESAEMSTVGESAFEGSGIRGDDTVYATQQGNYFHLIPDCSDMVGARDMTAMAALFLGKKSCPVCLSGVELSVAFASEEVPSWMRGSVYAEYGAVKYFHRDAVCSDRENPRELSVYDALREAEPCPDCLPEEQYAAVAVPEETVAGLKKGAARLYYTQNGNYFHRRSNCSNMRNAEGHTPHEALTSGKSPCPVCLEGWSYVVAALPADVLTVAAAEPEVYSVTAGESGKTMISLSGEAVEFVDLE